MFEKWNETYVFGGLYLLYLDFFKYEPFRLLCFFSLSFDVFIICDKFRFVNMFLDKILFIFILLVNCVVVYIYSNNYVILYIPSTSFPHSPPYPIPAVKACMYGFYGFFLSPHPRNKTAKAMQIPAIMRNRSEYTPKAADTFSQESPAILPA